MHGLQPVAHLLHGGRHNPVVERRAIAQYYRLVRQDRYVMPWIIDRLATVEAAVVLTDLDAVQNDPLAPPPHFKRSTGHGEQSVYGLNASCRRHFCDRPV